jgi:RNA polymerase sigma-70 factor (ECF subfamily)
VESYEREALAHALAILGNREDALDVVQEAFVDAYQALDRFDTRRRFYPWFYVILRNRCLKLLQRRTRQPIATSLADGDELIVRSESARENLMSIHDALMQLDAEDREIILLKHIDGLTCDELAERLEIPAGTVMSRLYHARRRLRERLQ